MSFIATPSTTATHIFTAGTEVEWSLTEATGASGDMDLREAGALKAGVQSHLLLGPGDDRVRSVEFPAEEWNEDSRRAGDQALEAEEGAELRVEAADMEAEDVIKRSLT